MVTETVTKSGDYTDAKTTCLHVCGWLGNLMVDLVRLQST